MSSKFDQFSFLGMSNSEFFLLKEDRKEIEFEISSRPTLEIPNGCQDTASNNNPELDDHQEDQHQQEDDKKEDEKREATVSSEDLKKPSLGELNATDDDDGFRTPTCSDHKIPVITQCPPAPRKIRPPPSTKRKMSPKLRRNLQVDLSKEVESMFPPPLQDDIGRKIKKARKDDTE